MKSISHFLMVLSAMGAAASDWKIAQPGWLYEFPRDHYAHDEFKTEWWYFTGNLFDLEGRRFGYQLTFFRHGIRSPEKRDPHVSRFIVNDLKFSHFTVTDVAGGEFHFQQKTSRGAFGESGFGEGERIAWIDSWTLRMDRDGIFYLKAENAEAAIQLRLEPQKPPVMHGERGVSKKALGEGHSSHYYSMTRLGTTGAVRVGSKTFEIRGESWFDHEWATNQLAPQQVGWDWLSVQWDDGTELMLYQMRLANGGADPSSSGTFITRDGEHLPSSAFRMRPVRFWKSKTSGATYPIAWRVEIPERQLEFNVEAVLEDQELTLEPLTYWEGAINATGTREGKPLKGRGYLELTGYAGPLRELGR